MVKKQGITKEHKTGPEGSTPGGGYSGEVAGIAIGAAQTAADLQSQSAETHETIDDPALENWIKNEQEDGATVDEVKLSVIENAKYLTPEQAVEIVRKLAHKLWTMLPPYEGYSFERGYVYVDIDTDMENPDGSKMTTEDIIGKDRDSEQTIHVSRTARPEYGGTVEQQEQHAKKAEANIVSLSPGENLERLLHIAKEVWNADENKDKTDDEKKKAVSKAIKKADGGDVRNYQQKPVHNKVLRSWVHSKKSQIFVGSAEVEYNRANDVGAAKKKTT